MSYRNKTYIIFDGDYDQWAYRFMNGWKTNEHIDFNFFDAHDVGSELTDRASEQTVKRTLRLRFADAKQVIVLIGKNTKNLYRFVRWELDLALDLKLPIIGVNLNDARSIDADLCPSILRDEYIVYIPFKMKIIQYALDQFPGEYNNRPLNAKGPRLYPESVYVKLGL